MKARRSLWTRLAGVGAALALALLGLNLYGQGQSLRSALVAQAPADFSHDRFIDPAQAWARLAELDVSDRRSFALRASEIIGQSMKHLRYDGEDFAERLYGAYHLTVPAWENYFLYLFRFLKPDTYKSYELSGYRRALERGIGQCGQQAMTVIGFLEERGFETGFIQLNGHVVATAEVAPGAWYVLDPDYGVSIPHSLGELERDRALVERYYGRFLDRNPWRLYGETPNTVAYGGPGLRYPRGSVIEEIAYIAKWAFPAALLALSALALVAARRGKRRRSEHAPA